MGYPKPVRVCGSCFESVRDLRVLGLTGKENGIGAPASQHTYQAQHQMQTQAWQQNNNSFGHHSPLAVTNAAASVTVSSLQHQYQHQHPQHISSSASSIQPRNGATSTGPIYKPLNAIQRTHSSGQMSSSGYVNSHTNNSSSTSASSGALSPVLNVTYPFMQQQRNATTTEDRTLHPHNMAYAAADDEDDSPRPINPEPLAPSPRTV